VVLPVLRNSRQTEGRKNIRTLRKLPAVQTRL
jgi:hypothetical protein